MTCFASSVATCQLISELVFSPSQIHTAITDAGAERSAQWQVAMALLKNLRAKVAGKV